MKGKFPGVLWLLPICFGLFGGVIAGLVASIKYQASWWELVVGGLLVTVVCYVILFAMPFALIQW